MFESIIVFMLTTIGATTILLGIGHAIISQTEYQSRLKSSVDECQKTLKELREMLRQHK